MVWLLLVLIAGVNAVSEEECSYGDLDFLCSNPEVCHLYISEAEKTLCQSLQDSAPSASSGQLPPTPEPTSESLYVSSSAPGTEPNTRDRVTGQVTRGDVSGFITNVHTTHDAMGNMQGGGDGAVEIVNDGDVSVPVTRSRVTGRVTGGSEAPTGDDMGNMRGDDKLVEVIEDIAVAVVESEEAEEANRVTAGTRGTNDYTTVLAELSTTAAAQIQFEKEATAATFSIAPEIVTAPRNITVPPGGLARFLCLSKGAPTPQTTITKLDETIEPDRNSFRQTVADRESSISMIQEIENVVEANEGWYRCLSCNYYGCAKADGYLRVLDLCNNVNCKSPMVCVADYELGTHSCECPDYCEGDTKPDFVCSNYCGTYYSPCQMKNEACANGRQDEAIWLKGYCPVDLTNPTTATLYNEDGDLIDQEVTVGEGESFSMTCQAESKPDPDYLWFKRGSDKVVGNGPTFTISNAKVDQSGQYFCQARACKSADKAVDSDFVDVVIESRLTTSAPVSSTPAGDGPDNLEATFPTTQCHVYGDPHFNTFDHKKYDFMGQCDYVLAMDCEAARWFVYGRMRPCGRGGSCLESVTLYFNNQIVELMRGWLVNHFGAKVSPKNFKNQEILVGNTFNMVFDGRYLNVDFTLDENFGMPKKVSVVWDGYVSVEIHTPNEGRTCGLCGNNNADPADDFKTRRNGLTESPEAFGDSWKIDRYNRCPETQPQQTNAQICGSKLKKVTKECKEIFNLPNFNVCKQFHDPASYIEACIYDVCAGSNIAPNYPPKCAAAGAYASRCEHQHYFRENPGMPAQFDVSGWEEAVSCPNSDELFDTILDVGCPQPAAADDDATRALFVVA